MAASWLLEKEKEEGGHQAIIFGLLAGLLLAATWAIETLVPFEGWWQALRLGPRGNLMAALAYAFLTKGSGWDRSPDDGGGHDGKLGCLLLVDALRATNFMGAIRGEADAEAQQTIRWLPYAWIAAL